MVIYYYYYFYYYYFNYFYYSIPFLNLFIIAPTQYI